MKILILSCNTGEGHNSAARAIAEELERRGIESEIKDSLAFASERFSKEICKAYIKMTLNIPKAMGATYKMAERETGLGLRRKSFIYTVNSICAPSLHKYLEKTKPDAVIMTHLFAGEVMTAVKRQYKYKIPTYLVSTDYDFCPHFDETEVDRYFIPHEHLIDSFLKHGIQKKKLSPVGIPISHKFLTKTPQEEAKAKLGLHKTIQYALIMTGSMGYGSTRDLVSLFLKTAPANFGVVVLGGNNSRMKNELREKYPGNKRVVVVDFTDEVPLYMDACDLLLTKPGGLSSTEAAAHGIPLVHTTPIPGCETDNLHFFGYHGMSLGARDTEEAVKMASYLLGDTAARERMLEAQNQYINKHSADDLCSILLDDLAK
ncbi:MAG: glycosyl transferase [Clostridia bacterium]|nr:glycosyl transferase [Clostridia bacterium]